MGEGKQNNSIDKFVRREYGHLFAKKGACTIGEFIMLKEQATAKTVRSFLSKNHKLIGDYYFVRSIYRLSKNLAESEENFASYLALQWEFEKDKEKIKEDLHGKLVHYWTFSKEAGVKGGILKHINRIGKVATDLHYLVDLPEIIKYFQSKIPEFPP